MELEAQTNSRAEVAAIGGVANVPAAVHEGADVRGDANFQTAADIEVAIGGISQSGTASEENVRSQVSGFNRVAKNSISADVVQSRAVGGEEVLDANSKIAREDVVEGESAACSGTDQVTIASGFAEELMVESVNLEFGVTEERCGLDRNLLFEGFPGSRKNAGGQRNRRKGRQGNG